MEDLNRDKRKKLLKDLKLIRLAAKEERLIFLQYSVVILNENTTIGEVMRNNPSEPHRTVSQDTMIGSNVSNSILAESYNTLMERAQSIMDILIAREVIEYESDIIRDEGKCDCPACNPDRKTMN